MAKPVKASHIRAYGEWAGFCPIPVSHALPMPYGNRDPLNRQAMKATPRTPRVDHTMPAISFGQPRQGRVRGCAGGAGGQGAHLPLRTGEHLEHLAPEVVFCQQLMARLKMFRPGQVSILRRLGRLGQFASECQQACARGGVLDATDCHARAYGFSWLDATVWDVRAYGLSGIANALSVQGAAGSVQESLHRRAPPVARARVCVARAGAAKCLMPSRSRARMIASGG